MRRETRHFINVTAAGILLLATATTSAAKEEEDDEREIAIVEAPAAVQATFRRIAGTSTIDEVSREETAGKVEYEAEFKTGGGKYSITVTADGTLVEVEKKLKVTDLPGAVKSALESKYPGAKLKGAEALYTTENLAGAPDLYEVEVKADKKKIEVRLRPSGEIVSAK